MNRTSITVLNEGVGPMNLKTLAGAYLKIPGCEHLYHMMCLVERNDSDANMYCVVCNNYIRISILSDIHKRQIDELLKLFNVRRRRRMNLTGIGNIDDFDMMNV